MNETSRPDLAEASRNLLTRVERFHLLTAQRSFEPGVIAKVVRWFQGTICVSALRATTARVHHLHHMDRLPESLRSGSFILVCNHRSFFDFYAVAPEFVARKYRQRILFPVRANFFYANILGFFINGMMSSFAMYPPIFRDPKRAHLNLMGLDDAIWLLRQGGHMLGFHPEGTRNTGDPYELLPARTGIGRIIRHAQVPVIPVFTNGITVSDAWLQLKYNITKSGPQIHTVFGSPIDFGKLLEEEPSQSVYKRIANKTREAIMALGQEEREARAAFTAQSSS